MELNTEKDELGRAISPVLSTKTKNYLIDIDGTITDDVPNEEPERMSTCLPYEGSVDTINTWYDQGHIITFFTSRTDEHEIVTKQLLEDPCNVNLQDEDGGTPIHSATENGHASVTELLIAAHRNVYLQSKDGFTPIRVPY